MPIKIDPIKMINNKFTVVMYHYVRDLKFTRYPAIKGLDQRLFKVQLQYFKKHYNFITAEQLVDAMYDGGDLPRKALLLTFDDAYLDHFANVFPLLDEMGIQGIFFAPVKAILNHEVLTVNKIHHILAVCETKLDELLSQLKRMLAPWEGTVGVKKYDEYFKELAVANRWDCKEVIFFKRMLQTTLPLPLRSQIANQLFEQYVTSDEQAFSRELYMSEDQLKCMIRHGMIVGSHGYDHFWLSSISRERQEAELRQSLAFLHELGVDDRTLSIGYPYGDYNDETLSLAKDMGFKLGFTCQVEIASTSLGKSTDSLIIPRLDTNDFPKDANADVNEWFEKG